MHEYTMANGRVIKYEHLLEFPRMVLTGLGPSGEEVMKTRMREFAEQLAAKPDGAEYIMAQCAMSDEYGFPPLEDGASIDDAIEHMMAWVPAWCDDESGSYLLSLLGTFEESDVTVTPELFEEWLTNGSDLLLRIYENDESLPSWRA
jgi:hypothetical protein